MYCVLGCAGERGWIAGSAAIGVMAATMPLEVVSRRMQVSLHRSPRNIVVGRMHRSATRFAPQHVAGVARVAATCKT